MGLASPGAHHEAAHNGCARTIRLWCPPACGMTANTTRTAGRGMTDWDDICFFLAVARGGLVRAAAERLGVNHATVLRRVAGLEARLGARLFDRLHSGYRTTAAGGGGLSSPNRWKPRPTSWKRACWDATRPCTVCCG